MSQQRNRNQRRQRPKPCYQILESRSLLASLTVTTFQDVIDSADGVLSLREAITESNNNAEDDTIVLAEGTYNIEISGFGEDLGLTGDFDILPDSGHQLTLKGQGSGLTIIDGQKLDRVFQVHLQSNVSFEDLQVTGGETQESVEIGSRGGGIWAAHSHLTLQSVSISDNAARERGVGGGVWVAGGRYSFTETTFASNVAGESGSGLFTRNADGNILLSEFVENEITDQASGAVYVIYGDANISRTQFLRNVGGGISADQSDIHLFHNRFLANTGTHSEGGFGLQANESTVFVNDSRFVRNERIGIQTLGELDQLEVVSSFFLENEEAGIDFLGAELVVGTSEFLGVKSDSDRFDDDSMVGIKSLDFRVLSTPNTISVTDSTFFQHESHAIQVTQRRESDIAISGVTVANSHGNGSPDEGAISLRVDIARIFDSVVGGSQGGAGIDMRGDEFQLIGSTIHDNEGAGLRLHAASAQILNSRIVNNTNRFSQNGGGIYFDGHSDPKLLIANSEISNNRAEDDTRNRPGRGGALAIGTGTATVNIVSSTLVKNSATGEGGVVWAPETIPAPTTVVTFENSILWGNHAPADRLFSGPGEFSVTFSLIQDDDPNDGNIPFGGSSNNNIDDNPVFFDWNNGNYRLRNSSPAIDAGNNSALVDDDFDIDGDNDFLEPAPDLDLLDRIIGAATDMGSFEYLEIT